MTEESHDSTGATLRHSRRVAALLETVVTQLIHRGNVHDQSKLEEPELAVFDEVDEYTPKLRDSTYGSPEYMGFLAAMGAGLQHHYAHNRHHPEWSPRGIDGMTLIDIVEMLADWKASTERHANGDILRSLEIQRERFHIGPQLHSILLNTVRELGWAA